MRLIHDIDINTHISQVYNIFESREIDPEHQYLRHPVYFVMEKLLLRKVTALFVCT